jgi:hypothetical protein
LNVEAPVRLAPLTHSRAKKTHSGTPPTTAKSAGAKIAPATKSAGTNASKTGAASSHTKSEPTVSQK